LGVDIVLRWVCDLRNFWGDTLFVELANVVDGWLWRGGRVDNMTKIGFGYFGKLAVERARDRMGSIVDGEVSIAWCA
jgi:hypothetical protein